MLLLIAEALQLAIAPIIFECQLLANDDDDDDDDDGTVVQDYGDVVDEWHHESFLCVRGHDDFVQSEDTVSNGRETNILCWNTALMPVSARGSLVVSVDYN